MLFRKEVVETRRRAHLGTIRLVVTPFSRNAAAIGLLFIIGLSALAFNSEVARTEEVPGMVAPALGLVFITAPGTGVIKRWNVEEGRTVPINSTLFSIDVERRDSLGKGESTLLEQSIETKRLTIINELALAKSSGAVRRLALNDRVQRGRLLTANLEEEVRLQERRADIRDKAYKRIASLHQDGFIANAQVQNEEELLLEARARRSAADRNLGTARGDLFAAEKDLYALELELSANTSRLTRELQLIEREVIENTLRREISAVAPSGGVLSTINLRVGSNVQAGQVVASFMPEGSAASQSNSLVIELFAPSRTAGHLRIGGKAKVRLSAYPFQKYGVLDATFTEISSTPINPQDLPTGQAQALTSAARAVEPLFRIRAKIDSQGALARGMRLRPGMTLSAHLIQETRRVWEWAFEPILVNR